MLCTQNAAFVRMYLHAYIHFERAGTAQLVVAATTRMLDARPPGESMEHPLTTHSPSVSVYPLASHWHTSRIPLGLSLHGPPFVFCTFLLSSPCFHPFAYQHFSFSLSLLSLTVTSFLSCAISIFEPISKLHILNFSLFKESQSLPVSFSSTACQFHPSSPVLTLCNLYALPFM